MSLPVREANQKNQVHKGREQFWCLIIVAVNIAVTAFVTIIVMEVDENATGPSKNLITLLKCDNPLNSKTERLREWFDTLDQQMYFLGEGNINFWLSNINIPCL